MGTRLARAHGLSPLTILAGNLRARGAGRVVSSLARAGRSATRGRRRRRWVAAFIFRDGDGDGWQDRRGAVAVAAAAGAEIWGRCRQHPAGTSAWTIVGGPPRFEGSAEKWLR